ncbi:MAG: DUF2238 domain-containing protein [Pyrinomonadaceae bacterium]
MSLPKRFEIPLALLGFVCGAAFLLKMCYLSLGFNSIFGITFLSIVYLYARRRFGVTIPAALLILVFIALQVDVGGNYFRMYGRRFGPMQYDEFSHLTVQILVTPIFVWLVDQTLYKSHYRLSPSLTAFFAATTVFSLSAFYEIIELWDEVYFNGHRIWGPHDTANDLQWDLCGIVAGTLLATVLSALAFRRNREIATAVSGLK